MNKNDMAVFAMIAMLLSATTALVYAPAQAQTQVGVGVGAEIKVGAGNNTEKSEESETNSKTSESETKISVSISDGKTSVRIQSDGQTNAYVLDTDDEAKIITSIESETGLSEEEIKSIWDFKIRSNVKSETKSSVSAQVMASASAKSDNRIEAKSKAIEIIAELKQKLVQLEQRFQTILVKLETGTYFGNTLGGDNVTTNYQVTLDGKAAAISDASTEVDYSGELFLESIVTRDNQSKFKVTGGHIEIDGQTYEVLFGKTRTSLGFSGEKDTMVVICQVLDNNGQPITMKLLLEAGSEFEGNFGEEPETVNVKMPSSKIASKWFLDGSGQISLA